MIVNACEPSPRALSPADAGASLSPSAAPGVRTWAGESAGPAGQLNVGQAAALRRRGEVDPLVQAVAVLAAERDTSRPPRRPQLRRVLRTRARAARRGAAAAGRRGAARRLPGRRRIVMRPYLFIARGFGPRPEGVVREAAGRRYSPSGGLAASPHPPRPTAGRACHGRGHPPPFTHLHRH